MQKKITRIEKKMYDVVTVDEYLENSNLYNASSTAIEVPELNSVLPIKSKLDVMNETGICPSRSVNIINTNHLTDEYNSSNVIDLNSKNMKEVLMKTQAIKSLETEILLSSDNIYKAKIEETDSVALRALKEAIDKKQCDPDSYSQRFGPNYNNDIRLIKKSKRDGKNKISLDKLVSIADNMDIRVTLSLEDKNPNVPNPMNDKITVVLTEGEEE